MFDTNKSRELSTDRVPLREFAADHGRRSRSPSPPGQDTSHSDTNDGVRPPGDDQLEASDSLLRYTGKPPQETSTKLHAINPTIQEKEIRVKQSFLSILLPRLVRCGICWCLIAGFYVSLWSFKDRVISPRKKSVFDTITTGLSIAFGLTIASSLKGVALDLRWWMLSTRKRSSQEVELALHLDSMTALLKLIYVAPRTSTIIPCVSWLSLNLLSQIGIALVSLTYSANPGIEDIYRRPGLNDVSVPNMSTFSPTRGRFLENYVTESLGAHLFGDIGSSYNISKLPSYSLSGKPWASNPAEIWNGTNHWEYVFRDSAPTLGASGPSSLSIYTDQTANATGVCTTPPYRFESKDNTLVVITFLDWNRTALFPSFAAGSESITYLVTPILHPEEGKSICGPGCSNIKVLEPKSAPPVPGSFSADGPFYIYDCNITVVSNKQDLSPLQAAVAAQAIGLSGQVHIELRNTPKRYNQYVPYQFGLTFGEPQNNSATGMASLLSRFAIGVIAAAAQTNPSITVQGGQPAQGVRIRFDSPSCFHIIFALTAGLQLLLVILAALIVYRIPIPKEIPLSEEEEIQDRFVLKSEHKL